MRHTECDDFDTALLSHVGLIRHIGRRRLAERDALDDFTQEVLTRSYAHRARLGDPDKLSKWLAAIARNTATDWNRKQRPTPVAELPEIAARFTPGSLVEDSERWTALLHALRSLDPTDQDIVYRRYFHDESYERLGERHGLSPEAIGFRLHRSRGLLRRRLEGLLAAIGFTLGIRARGAFIGGIALKMGHRTTLGIAAAVAIVTFGVAGTILLADRRRALPPEPARSSVVAQQAATGHPLASSGGDDATAAGPSKPSDDPVSVSRPEDAHAPASQLGESDVSPDDPPAAIPREQAEAALDDMLDVIQNWDPLVDPDALVERSSGQARQLFEAMRQFFTSDPPPPSFEVELAELQRVDVLTRSFGGGEMRASLGNAENPNEPPVEMVLRLNGDTWMVVEMK